MPQIMLTLFMCEVNLRQDTLIRLDVGQPKTGRVGCLQDQMTLDNHASLMRPGFWFSQASEPPTENMEAPSRCGKSWETAAPTARLYSIHGDVTLMFPDRPWTGPLPLPWSMLRQSCTIRPTWSHFTVIPSDSERLFLGLQVLQVELRITEFLASPPSVLLVTLLQCADLSHLVASCSIL